MYVRDWFIYLSAEDFNEWLDLMLMYFFQGEKGSETEGW